MPFVYMPDPAPMGPAQFTNVESETLKIAKAIIKENKAEKKRKAQKEKDKIDKAKPHLFTYLETSGLIALLSIPVVIGQFWLLNYAQNMMIHLLQNVPH